MAGASTTVATAAKKAKGRAPAPPDPVEASRQIAAKIAQLERESAGEKDQDAEIDQEVRKANREITQLLSKIESPTERANIVRDKYLHLVADFRRLDREYQKIKKRTDQHIKERDALRTDLAKSNSIKEKLAKMSRDTVAEIKVLKASLEKMESTEIRSRQELHDRLDRMISDVHNVVRQPDIERRRFSTTETDREFKSKFNSFVIQQELRELQYLSMLRTMHIVQLSQDARLERKSKAQELESSRTHQLSRQVSAISQTESELRSQLNVYVEKFRQVEETLNSSNDLFLTFRKEMEDMSQKTKRLEKENQLLTRKVDSSARSILELADERSRAEKRCRLLEKRNRNLEKICRGVQSQVRQLPDEQEVDDVLSDRVDRASPQDRSKENDRDPSSDLELARTERAAHLAMLDESYQRIKAMASLRDSLDLGGPNDHLAGGRNSGGFGTTGERQPNAVGEQALIHGGQAADVDGSAGTSEEEDEGEEEIENDDDEEHQYGDDGHVGEDGYSREPSHHYDQPHQNHQQQPRLQRHQHQMQPGPLSNSDPNTVPNGSMYASSAAGTKNGASSSSPAHLVGASAPADPTGLNGPSPVNRGIAVAAGGSTTSFSGRQSAMSRPS